jgi:hypothetical protein
MADRRDAGVPGRAALAALVLALLPACAGEVGRPLGGAGAAHPCAGRWEVIARGDYVDRLRIAWTTTWTSSWRIHPDGKTEGTVVPDAPGWPTYAMVGVRTAPGVGSSDGRFPTPPELRPQCRAETVAIHVDYAIKDGVFTGQATYRCPEVLGPYALTGDVTCGAP